MHNGSGKVDVSHAFPTDSAVGNLHAASVAGHSFVFHSPIFSAGTLPVFFGTEDFFAEESVSFGSIGSIINGFWFSHFAVRPAAHVAWLCETDFYSRIIVNSVVSKFVAHRKTLYVMKVIGAIFAEKSASPPSRSEGQKGYVPTGYAF